jgi:hypothetical protein
MSSQYTEQLQRLGCLLFVLGEITSLPAKTQEVMEYIRQRRYLGIRPEDLKSYVTQIEPRWNTDIAFRRKDGVEWGLLFKRERDAWDLTRDGIELLEKLKQACISKEYDVRECYLWTKQLKKALDPSYEPSPADKPRPQKFRMRWGNIFKDFV